MSLSIVLTEISCSVPTTFTFRQSTAGNQNVYTCMGSVTMLMTLKSSQEVPKAQTTLLRNFL